MSNVFILNPNAGLKQTEKLSREIRTRFGPEAEILFTSAAGDATKLAKFRPDSTIFAVGGDGTVNEIANALAGTESTLCIIPAGSGNDFARTVYRGFPSRKRTPNGVFRAFDTLIPKRFDCGKVNGEIFDNIFSVGYDAEVVRNAQRYRKFPVLRRFSYILSVFYTIFHYHGTDLEAEIDGVIYRKKALLFCVANGEYYGGGIRIAPEAVPDDGLLDAYLIESVSPWRFLSVLPLLAIGKHTKTRYVQHFSAKSVTVRGKNLTLNIDGELTPGDEANIEVLPASLRILAPQEAKE